MNRIDAMTGIGISAAYGISTTNIRRSTTAWTMPAMGERPPFFTLAAVRAMAPVAGIPPNSADAMLPVPCAISSVLELWWLPIIPSETTQERSDSIPARMAIVNALGSSSFTMENDIFGAVNFGRLRLIVYRSPIVLTLRPANFTINTPTITAISEPGIFLLIFGHTIWIASASRPIRSAW